MSSVDFVMYCAGIGIFIVSIACAVRLLRKNKVRNTEPVKSGSPPVRTTVSDPQTEQLEQRLLEFQSKRFGPELVRRSAQDISFPLQRRNRLKPDHQEK